MDGFLVCVLVGGYLQFVRDGRLRPWFRRLTFATDLALSTLIVVALFMIGRGIGHVVTSRDPAHFLRSFTETHLVYALPFFIVFAIATLFVLRMNRMIGANVLRYFVAGRYHRPTAEERIFLFLDLEGSTTLAERLGSAPASSATCDGRSSSSATSSTPRRGSRSTRSGKGSTSWRRTRCCAGSSCRRRSWPGGAASSSCAARRHR